MAGDAPTFTPAAAAAPPPPERRVLLLPPTERDGQASRRLLAAAGVECVLCASVAHLCAELDAGAAAAVVPEEAVRADSAECLAAAIRRQPVWSDLPVVVLARGGVESPAIATALATLGNVSLVERPIRVSTLLSVVRAAVRARDRQYQVRDHLAALARAEEGMRRSKERLDLAVEASQLGTFYCPLPFGHIEWNATCKAHFWLPPDAEVDIDLFFARLHPDDRDRVRAALDRAVVRHEPYDVEYRTVAPDGRVRWVRAIGRGFYDAAGTPTRFDGITIDVTDRKAAEADRAALLDRERAARAEAEHAGRLKDEFLATLGHELRTPLNAILGYAQLLRTATAAGDQGDLAEGLEVIERNARAQTQIIEDLLDMSRIMAGKVRLDVVAVDLGAVVRAAVDTVRPSADAKGVRLQPVLDPRAGPVAGDPDRLQQVVWNLLSNAIKFTPRGGWVRVVLRRVDSHLEVAVSDSGQGIAPDFLPHVFERFRQADASSTRQHGGLGLGLSIVKQLVELHGGTITAASDGADRGATFVVVLPLAAVADDDAGAASLSGGAASHGGGGDPAARPCAGRVSLDGLRVLVVDDERDARELVRRLLEQCGAAVTTAASADDALALLDRGPPPDVLLSDIGMPETDGYELLRRVRARENGHGGGGGRGDAGFGARPLPAAALTAFARSEDRTRALLAGYQTHVAKPVDAAELIATVASLAGRFEGHDAPGDET